MSHLSALRGLTSRCTLWAAVISLTAFFPFLVLPAPAQDSSKLAPDWAPDPVAGRLLVKYTLNADASVQRAARAKIPDETGNVSLDLLHRSTGVLDIERAIPSPGSVDAGRAVGLERWYVLALPETADLDRTIRAFEQSPHVEAVHPSLPITPLVVPNDPHHGDHWGHNNVGQFPVWDESCPPGCGHDMGHCLGSVGTIGFDTDMESAWDEPQGFGDTSIVIAVIDFGFDTDHYDIRWVPGYDFFDDDNDPDDDNRAHGTNCCGVAAAIANNGLGVAGVAGGCSVMPIRGFFTEQIAQAIVFAADNGASIISMSIAFVGATTLPLVDDALTAASDDGLVLFAASGNAGDSLLWVPATHPDVITVGAADPCGNRKTPTSCDGEFWWGSSYGGTTPDSAGTIDLIAPTLLPTTDNLGVDGDSPDDYCFYFGGTSCAAPYAAGVAALLLSANPTWTPEQVRERLVGTAVDIVNAESGPGWDPYTGYGLVSGAAITGSEVGVPPGASARALSLHVFPNPSSSSVSIAYAVPPGARHRLRVYDVTGRMVRELRALGERESRLVEWDGRSTEGFALPAGTYFVRLSTDNESLTRKFVRIARE